MRNRIYVFDLDGTLCYQEEDYAKAKPIIDRIRQVNNLYDDGHHIIVDTARGITTGIDWKELTEKQLKDWGLKYHQLRLGGKLHADFFIDDKGINASDFFELNTV